MGVQEVAVRFVAFGAYFALVHHYITGGKHPAADYLSSAAEPKTCEKDNFFCTEQGDSREARAQRTNKAIFYLNYGVAQTMEGSPEETAKMKDTDDSMMEYLRRWIITDVPESLKQKCVNKQEKCLFWSSIGECAINPGFMEDECILACQKCEKLLETPPSEL
ncbi:hypothetical protein ACHAXT_008600 [Thalassiosira profunda]